MLIKVHNPKNEKEILLADERAIKEFKLKPYREKAAKAEDGPAESEGVNPADVKRGPPDDKKK